MDAIRDVMRRFEGGPKAAPVAPDVPKVEVQPQDDFEDVALRGIAEAVHADTPEVGGVEEPAARSDAHWLPDEGESLLSLQGAVLAAWLWRLPEPEMGETSRPIAGNGTCWRRRNTTN